MLILLLLKIMNITPKNNKDIDDVNQLDLSISPLEVKVNNMQKLLQAELTGKETTVIRLSMNYAEVQKLGTF